jgi:hypothetical protein
MELVRVKILAEKPELHRSRFVQISSSFVHCSSWVVHTVGHAAQMLPDRG